MGLFRSHVLLVAGLHWCSVSYPTCENRLCSYLSPGPSSYLLEMCIRDSFCSGCDDCITVGQRSVQVQYDYLVVHWFFSPVSDSVVRSIVNSMEPFYQKYMSLIHI